MNSVNVVALKPIFAANSANFRGAEKNPRQFVKSAAEVLMRCFRRSVSDDQT